MKQFVILVCFKINAQLVFFLEVYFLAEIVI